MKQYVHLDERLKEYVLTVEMNIEKLCSDMVNRFNDKFLLHKQQLIVELVRNTSKDIFDPQYESVIEIGVECEGNYFENAFIPIWRCKEEYFHLTGYFTTKSIIQIEQSIESTIYEMLEEIEG